MKNAPVDDLWCHFRAGGVDVLVLRDFESLPKTVKSDLDLSVRDYGSLIRVEEAIANFADAQALEVVAIVRRSYVWQFKLLGRCDPLQLVIDVHPDGEGWRGPLYLTSEELFDKAVDRGEWLEPHPAHQAMMAIFQHLLWGGFYKAKYHSIVPMWIADCVDEFKQCVSASFGNDISDRVVEWVMEGRVVDLERAVPELRWRLWKFRGLPDFPSSCLRLLRFINAELKLTLEKRGRWVVFVGPDGVGKTTIAGGLPPEVKLFFRDVRYHHWIPNWTQPLPKEVPPGGGKFEQESTDGGILQCFLSYVRLLRNVVRAHLAYILRIWPHLLRQRLVIGDRYLFNYIVDPESVRFYASQKWVRFAFRFLPKPDLVINLTADPKEVHRRKQELSVQEIEDLMVRAKSLRDLGFKVSDISADDSADTVLSAVALEVIRNLREAAPLSS